ASRSWSSGGCGDTPQGNECVRDEYRAEYEQRQQDAAEVGRSSPDLGTEERREHEEGDGDGVPLVAAAPTQGRDYGEEPDGDRGERGPAVARVLYRVDQPRERDKRDAVRTRRERPSTEPHPHEADPRRVRDERDHERPQVAQG